LVTFGEVTPDLVLDGLCKEGVIISDCEVVLKFPQDGQNLAQSWTPFSRDADGRSIEYLHNFDKLFCFSIIVIRKSLQSEKNIYIVLLARPQPSTLVHIDKGIR